jgi:hypothetical protein
VVLTNTSGHEVNLQGNPFDVTLQAMTDLNGEEGTETLGFDIGSVSVGGIWESNDQANYTIDDTDVVPNIVEALPGSETLAGTDADDVFRWDKDDDGSGEVLPPEDVVTGFDAASDLLDLSDILTGNRSLLAIDAGGSLKLQVVDGHDAGIVYQEITLDGIAFGSDEAASILQDLLDKSAGAGN